MRCDRQGLACIPLGLPPGTGGPRGRVLLDPAGRLPRSGCPAGGTGVVLRSGRGVRAGRAVTRCLEPFGLELGGRLVGADRDLAAHSCERELEDLGLVPVTGVLTEPLAPAPCLSDVGAGGPAVVLDVLAPRSPHPGVELEELVLVEVGD